MRPSAPWSVPARLEAISETGVELQLAEPLPTLPTGASLTLHLPAIAQGSLPLVLQARRRARVGGIWAWAVVLLRLLWPPVAEDWFRRSLIPQVVAPPAGR